MGTPEPQLPLPPRLMRQGAQCWLAGQQRPRPEREPFCTDVVYEETFDKQPSVEGVVAAASCLLGEHWEKLEEAAKVLISERGEDGACAAVSVLLAASYREAEPHAQAVDVWFERLNRVVGAVSFLVACNKTLLTAAARHVLLDDQETPGTRWVMEVIMTAFRLAEVPDCHEKLSGGTDGRYGALSMLTVADVRMAECYWLGACQGMRWPYTLAEMLYIRAANPGFTAGR